MTVNEAINRLDMQRQNTCSRQEKLGWLSELDGLVKVRILDTHEGMIPAQLPYDDSTEDSPTLLIPPPYDGLYIWWMEAKLHYCNGEIVRFNNAMDMFQAGYRDFAAQYNRVHKSRGGTKFF